MFTRFICSSLTLLLSVNTYAQVDTEPGSTGDFEWESFLSVDEVYDDNITMANGNTEYTEEINSWLTVLSPELEANLKTASSEYHLGYKLEAGRYESSRDDDYVDHFMNGSAAWQLNARNRVALRANYDRVHEDRGSDTSGIASQALREPDEYKAEVLGGSYTFGADLTPGQLVLDVEHFNKEYTNHRSGPGSTRGRDRANLTSTGTFYWRVSSATKILIEAEHTDIDYKQSSSTRDSRLIRAFFGATWDITGKTTGTVKLGLQDREFSSGARNDYDGSSWDVAMSWSPKSYSTFILSTARTPNESAGFGDFIDTEYVNLGWQHGWNNQLSSSVYLRAMTEGYINSSNGREDDSLSAGISLDYALKRWLNFRIGYDFSERDSNTDISTSELNSFDFARNRLTLGADLSF